jgi:DNA-binding NarL/FixJ family response regulator
MSTGTRQQSAAGELNGRKARSNEEYRLHTRLQEAQGQGNGFRPNEKKARLFIAAPNRLLREALARMVGKLQNIEVVGMDAGEPFRTEDLVSKAAELLLLTSRGSINEDLLAIRRVRLSSPEVHILLIGGTGTEIEFLQCVRAGVRGYLPRCASAEDVVNAVKTLRSGEAVCPQAFCGMLFHYLEREATSFPSASVHQRLGLTRREQQLIPLIAEGLTNKEIANRFCLSEQTVKNHLYRMKHKIGAGDRLSIVQVCRTQGFMV